MPSVLDSVTRVLPATRKGTEIERILALPRIDPSWQPPSLDVYVRKPGGTFKLREIQNKALYYWMIYKGLLGFIGVGEGKSGIAMMAATLLDKVGYCKPHEVLLLIPSSMRAGFRAEWIKFGPHFQLPHGINTMTFAELSRQAATAKLEALRPKAIIIDEADKLKDPTTVTTRRFTRFMEQHSIHKGGNTRLLAMSGTMAKGSLKDWAHLAEYALGPRSPLPQEWGDLELFCAALDIRKGGAPDKSACSLVGQLRDSFGGDTLREGFRRRLVTCPGIVVSGKRRCKAEAVVIPRKLEVPAAVQEVYDALAEDWILPNGDTTDCPLELNRKLREVALGFWYEWIWPNDTPDTEWIEARQGWHAALRNWLPYSAAGTDSPALVEAVCLAHMWHEHNPNVYPKPLLEVSEECYAAYAKWAQQKHKPVPPTRIVWIDQFAVHDAVAWANEQEAPALIWYEHEHFGYAVAQAGGFKFVEAGADSNALLANMKKSETLVISRNAHGRGKNLQGDRDSSKEGWYINLFVAPLSSGALTEQVYGRTLRPPTPYPRIYFHNNAHLPVFVDAMRAAKRGAAFIEDNHSTEQILQRATYTRPVSVPLRQPQQATEVRIGTLPYRWGYDQNTGQYAPCPAGWVRHPADLP